MQAVYTLILLVLPAAYLLRRHFYRPASALPVDDPAQQNRPLKNIMQAPKDDLAPPKDDPFTLEQLKEYDGTDPAKPIYVSIKGKRKLCVEYLCF
jgi:membrane-associated progesterone receptor component